MYSLISKLGSLMYSLIPRPGNSPHTHAHTHVHTLTEEKYIVLESVMYPGQHVGFLPDGVVKAPKETHTGLHARFVPVVLEAVSPCANRLHLLYMYILIATMATKHGSLEARQLLLVAPIMSHVTDTTSQVAINGMHIQTPYAILSSSEVFCLRFCLGTAEINQEVMSGTICTQCSATVTSL